MKRDRTEKWVDIFGFEGFYQVSNNGRIKSLGRVIVRKNGRKQTWPEKILRGTGSVYRCVQLKNIGKITCRSIHSLVGEYFAPNPDGLPILNHKDGNKLNNCDWNLEWTNHSGNLVHAYRENLRQSNARLTVGQAQKIRELYFSKENQSLSRYKRPWTHRNLAKKFNVNKNLIWNILNNKTYKKRELNK